MPTWVWILAGGGVLGGAYLVERHKAAQAAQPSTDSAGLVLPEPPLPTLLDYGATPSGSNPGGDGTTGGGVGPIGDGGTPGTTGNPSGWAGTPMGHPPNNLFGGGGYVTPAPTPGLGPPPV